MIADGLSRIAMSSGLATSLSRATDYARAHGHAEVTLEHMLLALCDDPDAILVLAASNVNVEELTSEVTTQLAALPSRPHATDVEFAVAADMRRILEAAAAAARGGRRREINGAIVLAAIVGDGKSAAAQVLSALGLTFECAIRALQSKPAPAAEQRQLPAPDAEAILASARERVQSRTGVAPRRVPMDDEGDYEDVAEPLQVEQERALPPPAYEPEPLEPEPHQEQLTGAPNYHQYEPAPSYEPEAEPAFEPARAAGSDHYQEAEPQYEPHQSQPNFEGSYEHRGPPPMPASAPFPPPLPVPDSRHSWTPPPRGPALPSMPAPASAPPRPGPPQLAPWPEEGRAPMGIGAGGGERFNPALGGRTSAPPQAAPRPGARTVLPRTEIGQLVENIPRSMRVAVPALIEVRIARADVQALAEGLQGGGAAYQHEVMVTKAMSVRLRAPDGGFFIETASAETQWIERAMLLSSEEFASWRWHVTPRDKGRRRLQLIISARTVSADGLAVETALPDQVITVRVHTNYAKVAGRWAGWGAAAVAGGLLAKFGEGAFDSVARLITG
jgi:neural Wiskott-Aldrich syndrome protein